MNLDSFDAFAKLLSGIAASLGIIFGALKTYESARKLKTASPPAYEVLEDRVVKLERSDEANKKEINKLRTQLYRATGALVREANTVVSWYKTGRPEPFPDHEVSVLDHLITEIKEDMRAP